MIYLNEELCDCHCHTKGIIVMHCFPCCDLCEEKYLNEDGSLDIEALEKIKFKYSDKK